jgi:hypothetical protein
MTGAADPETGAGTETSPPPETCAAAHQDREERTMLIRNLKFAVAAVLFAALGACDGGALMGPEDAAIESPQARTACLAGGEVAIRAGCPDPVDGAVGNQMDKFRRMHQPE